MVYYPFLKIGPAGLLSPPDHDTTPFQEALMSSLQSTPFRLKQEPPPPRLLGFGPDITDAAFTVKYRPQRLAELYGQPTVVERLRTFLARPYPCCMMFSGVTGAGKTSTAFALATELGVYWAADWLHIESGDMDGGATEEVIRALRYAPWKPGGWRVVLVDEGDLWSPRSRKLWLSRLEDLPVRTIIIFTTNRKESFQQRELDRFIIQCDFVTAATESRGAAQAYCDMIWEAETGKPDGPDVSTLPNIVERGHVSFRRVATAMESLIRYGIAPSAAPISFVAPPVVTVAAGPNPSTSPSAKDRPTPEPGTLAEKRSAAAHKAWATMRRQKAEREAAAAAAAEGRAS
jgi:hypothetical protein